MLLSESLLRALLFYLSVIDYLISSVTVFLDFVMSVFKISLQLNKLIQATALQCMLVHVCICVSVAEYVFTRLCECCNVLLWLRVYVCCEITLLRIINY